VSSVPAWQLRDLLITLLRATVRYSSGYAKCTALLPNELRCARISLQASASSRSFVIAPDCGLKYLPRDVAFGKMKAMVEGAAIVRREHAKRLPHRVRH
jgi:hypothetical protein